MYTPTARLLTILELLQARGRLGGAELAARLEVDGRTVRRYITTLQDLGIPIEAERGRYGAYRLRPGFKLPPLLFTDEEALAVTLGLLLGRQLGLGAAAPAVEGALAKVERVLPVAIRSQVQAVADTLQFDLRPGSAAPIADALLTLGAAARDGQRVWLRYRTAETTESERLFDPYGIVYRAGYTYTIGYCHRRAAIRVFRLDRIAALEPRDAFFTPPADFDALAHVLHAIANVPRAWTVEVLLDLDPETARGRIPTAATLTVTPDGTLLRCQTEDLDWFAYILLGLRCAIIVHEPPELHAALARLAAAATTLAHTAAATPPPGD